MPSNRCDLSWSAVTEEIGSYSDDAAAVPAAVPKAMDKDEVPKGHGDGQTLD